MIEGWDESWGRANLAQMYALGKRFVFRYLDNGGTGKEITVAEAKQIHAVGIDIGLVWETGATRALAGTSAGTADARAAAQQLTALGASTTTAVYATVDDSSATTAQVLPYFRGFSSVLGPSRTGIYGFHSVVRGVLDSGLAKFALQTGGNTPLEAGAQIDQYAYNTPVAGANVDLLRAVVPVFGQWYARQPAPIPTPRESSPWESDSVLIDDGAGRTYLLHAGKLVFLEPATAANARASAVKLPEFRVSNMTVLEAAYGKPFV